MSRNLLLKISYILGFLLIIGITYDFFYGGLKLEPIPRSSSKIFHDRYGQELRHPLNAKGEREVIVNLDELPDYLLTAMIVAEDKRFYHHVGADWFALGRAILQFISSGRVVSGASTITMQLVKIKWPHLSGFSHKLTQILKALYLETQYSKGEILFEYLNSLPFGHNVSGLGLACLYFYDKKCEQLSLGESAALAIIPRNPKIYSRRLNLLKQRRQNLLKNIKDKFASKHLSHAINETHFIQAENEPIELVRKLPEFYAPHLTDLILREKKYSSKDHIIETTIDLSLQKYLQALLKAETINRPGTGDSGAFLVIENSSGHILGHVGSPDFFEPNFGMLDGVLSFRSPGSALKPFLYLLALEQNWNLFDLLPDIPMVFSTAKSAYSPNNFGGNFSGPRFLRDALGNSKNIPALYLASKIGPDFFLDFLKKLKFRNLSKPAKHYGVGLALGNAEVNLWDLTQAYSTLARGGILIENSYLPDQVENKQRVFSAESSYLISDVLQDADAREEEFGRFGPLEFPYQVAVKTGTSSDFRDNWIVGYTEKYTVGVWRGNARAEPLNYQNSAAVGVGPLFHRVMDYLHLHEIPSWISRPDLISEVKVCALSGQSPTALCPSVLIELVDQNKSSIKTNCDFHQKLIVPYCHGKKQEVLFTKLPAIYADWEKNSSIPNLSNQLKLMCGEDELHLHYSAQFRKNDQMPYITEPLNHSTFAIDPHIPLKQQQVRFVIAGINNHEDLSLIINGEPKKIQIKNGQFFWQIRKGKFVFKIINQRKMSSNLIEILVR